MRLVVVEANERQRADVDPLHVAVGLLDFELELEPARRRGFVAETVLIVLGGDVAGEGVEAVGPPETGAVVGIERQSLVLEALAAAGADGEVAIEHVVDFGAVLEKEAVAEALVADAIADDEVVGAVDGKPAVVAVPDAGTDHVAAAHG